MKDSEEKILKAQVALYADITTADNMIKYHMNNAIGKIFKEIIEPKMYLEEGQTTVVLTKEEFNKLRASLQNLSKPDTMHREFDAWAESMYITPREEKMKIINLLS